MSKKGVANWKIEIEEIILFLIIILNFLDAIEFLPSTLDYVKKIISWGSLGYLFYKSKPTKILFGTRKKTIDILVILAYFMLLIKDFVSYAISSYPNASNFMRPLFDLLINNQTIIEITGLYLGILILIVISFTMVMRNKIKGPSVMHIIHQEGPIPNNFKDFFYRISTGLFVLVAFYLIVFNLVMEWLAIAIDAPLLMIALAIYVFFIVKHKEKFTAKSFLARFGDYGTSFYEDVIEHFTYKKTILRALFAMLVLHIATEALHFILPFILGIADSLYFGLLDSNNLFASQIFIQDSLYLGFLDKSLLLVTLSGNIIAMLFLLLAPGYIWYLIYKNKKFSLSKMKIGILVSSLIMFFLSPVFRLRPLINQQILGVHIIPQSIVQNSLLGLETGVLISISTGLICAIFSSNKYIENNIMRLITFISQIFFTGYIMLFTFSISKYYIDVIALLFTYGKYLLSLIMVGFFIITLGFYIFGTLGFLKDTLTHAKEHLKVK